MKKVIKALFIIYILALIYILFLHNSYRVGLNTFNIERFSKEHLKMCNIIPFHTIVNYFDRLAHHTINTNIVVTNLLVNLILFFPMGIALPILHKKKFDQFWKFLIFIIIITVLVEILQFITLMGGADVDDVILNTIGACIGYTIIQIKSIRKILNLEE